MIHPEMIPQFALSVQQPWAWCIVDELQNGWTISKGRGALRMYSLVPLGTQTGAR